MSVIALDEPGSIEPVSRLVCVVGAGGMRRAVAVGDRDPRTRLYREHNWDEVITPACRAYRPPVIGGRFRTMVNAFA
jgi:hypothetical protein